MSDCCQTDCQRKATHSVIWNFEQVAMCQPHAMWAMKVGASLGIAVPVTPIHPEIKLKKPLEEIFAKSLHGILGDSPRLTTDEENGLVHLVKEHTTHVFIALNRTINEMGLSIMISKEPRQIREMIGDIDTGGENKETG